jgi:hypothetical protein
LVDGKLTDEGQVRICSEDCLNNDDLAFPPPNFTIVEETCPDSQYPELAIAKESLPMHDYLQKTWDNCGQEQGEDKDLEAEPLSETIEKDLGSGGEDGRAQLTGGLDAEGDSSANGPSKDEDENPLLEEDEDEDDAPILEDIWDPEEALTLIHPHVVKHIEALKPHRTMYEQWMLAYKFGKSLASKTKNSCGLLRTGFAAFDYRHTGRLTIENLLEMLDQLSNSQLKKATNEFQTLQHTAMHGNFVSFMDVVNELFTGDVNKSLRCYRKYVEIGDADDPDDIEGGDGEPSSAEPGWGLDKVHQAMTRMATESVDTDESEASQSETTESADTNGSEADSSSKSSPDSGSMSDAFDIFHRAITSTNTNVDSESTA